MSGNQAAAEGYIETAKHDLQAIHTLAAANDYYNIVFHIQQNVEKCLKALIYKKTDDVNYDVSHDHTIDVLYNIAYGLIGYDESILPSWIAEYALVLSDWEKDGRYPMNRNYDIWEPSDNDVNSIQYLVSLIPDWTDEVEYYIYNC